MQLSKLFNDTTYWELLGVCVCMCYLLLLVINVSLVNFHLYVFISTELEIFSLLGLYSYSKFVKLLAMQKDCLIFF